MTRPSGVTPLKSLPYPGSAGKHSDTPKAIQALAEAIDGQLSGIEGGLRFAFYTGNINIDGSGLSQLLVFPELKSVSGGIVSYGTFLGGIYRVGWPSAVNYTQKFSMMAANQSILYPPSSTETFNNTTISICVAAWGPPA